MSCKSAWSKTGERSFRTSMLNSYAQAPKLHMKINEGVYNSPQHSPSLKFCGWEIVYMCTISAPSIQTQKRHPTCNMCITLAMHASKAYLRRSAAPTPPPEWMSVGAEKAPASTIVIPYASANKQALRPDRHCCLHLQLHQVVRLLLVGLLF